MTENIEEKPNIGFYWPHILKFRQRFRALDIDGLSNEFHQGFSQCLQTCGALETALDNSLCSEGQFNPAGTRYFRLIFYRSLFLHILSEWRLFPPHFLENLLGEDSLEMHPKIFHEFVRIVSDLKARPKSSHLLLPDGIKAEFQKCKTELQALACLDLNIFQLTPAETERETILLSGESLHKILHFVKEYRYSRETTESSGQSSLTSEVQKNAGLRGKKQKQRGKKRPFIQLAIIGEVFEKTLDDSGTIQKKTGTYYTPFYLAEAISWQAVLKHLQEKIREISSDPGIMRIKAEGLSFQFPSSSTEVGTTLISSLAESFREMTICDIACGCGVFLEAGAQTLFQFYEAFFRDACQFFKVHGLKIPAAVKEPKAYRSTILSRIYGVDIEQEAIIVCQLRLFLWYIQDFPSCPPEEGGFLKEIPDFWTVDWKLNRGNSLVGLPFDKIKPLALSKIHVSAQAKNMKEYESPPSIENPHEIYLEDFIPEFELELPSIRSSTITGYKQQLQMLMEQHTLSSFKINLHAAKTNKSHLTPVLAPLSSIAYYTRKNKVYSIYSRGNAKSPNLVKWKTFEKIFAALDSNQVASIEVFRNLTADDLNYLGAWHWAPTFAEVRKNGGFDIIVGNPPYVRQEVLKHVLEKAGFKELLNFLANQWLSPYTLHTKLSSFSDFSIYFLLRAHLLLKEGGLLSYLITDKWLRTKYGAPIREFLTEHTTLPYFINLKGLDIFKSIAVETIVLTVQKQKPIQSHGVYYLQPNGIGNGESSWPTPVQSAKVHDKSARSSRVQSAKDQENSLWTSFHYLQQKLGQNPWSFLPPEVQEIKKWIETHGTRIKDLPVHLKMGIKTGYNDAFIISQASREKFAALNPKVREVTYPLLRGRNIEAFAHEWEKIYLICFPHGFTNAHRTGDPEEWITAEYPALFSHLLHYKPQLQKRQDQGEYWWELRQCDFYSDFDSPKIMIKELSLENPFYYDTNRFWGLAKVNMIFPNHRDYPTLKLLTLLLNTRLVLFYYQTMGIKLSRGFEFKKHRVREIYVRIPEELLVYDRLCEYQTFLSCSTLPASDRLCETQSFFTELMELLALELYFFEGFRADDLYDGELSLHDLIKDAMEPIPFDEWTRTHWKMAEQGSKPIQESLTGLSTEIITIIQKVKDQLASRKDVESCMANIRNHPWVQIIFHSTEN